MIRITLTGYKGAMEEGCPDVAKWVIGKWNYKELYIVVYKVRMAGRSAVMNLLSFFHHPHPLNNMHLIFIYLFNLKSLEHFSAEDTYQSCYSEGYTTSFIKSGRQGAVMNLFSCSQYPLPLNNALYLFI